ncbi:MAG: GTPase, partial [bacterium]|nr:GTPase [bacterium]
AGGVVYAGVDYEVILREAENEADIIIWDGGNNDFPFVRPDLSIVIADPLRPGDEASYYPGRTNLLMADIVIINKAESAPPEDIDKVLDNINILNPVAGIIETRSHVMIEDGASLNGKTVLVVEDGPTLTHGGMSFGAGIMAAELSGASEIDPRPYAVGSIKETFLKYPNIGYLVPAMGYSREQTLELEATINATPCDCVLVATPVDLRKIIKINKPAYRVRYEIEDMEEDGLEWAINNFMDERFG